MKGESQCKRNAPREQQRQWRDMGGKPEQQNTPEAKGEELSNRRDWSMINATEMRRVRM